jgi:hypothetical protein
MKINERKKMLQLRHRLKIMQAAVDMAARQTGDLTQEELQKVVENNYNFLYKLVDNAASVRRQAEPQQACGKTAAKMQLSGGGQRGLR